MQESATRNAGLHRAAIWVIYSDSLQGRGIFTGGVSVQMLSRGGRAEKPAVIREVFIANSLCRIFGGNEEVSSADVCRWSFAFGLSENMTVCKINRLIPLITGRRKSGDSRLPLSR